MVNCHHLATVAPPLGITRKLLAGFQYFINFLEEQSLFILKEKKKTIGKTNTNVIVINLEHGQIIQTE